MKNFASQGNAVPQDISNIVNTPDTPNISCAI